MRADTRCLAVVMAALAIAGCDARFGPTRPDSNWRTDTIGRFTFHTRSGSFAAEHTTTFAQVLEDQLETTRRLLDHKYDGRVTFFLHSSGADAGFGDDVGGGDHSGVAYPETETVKAVVVPPLDGNLLSLLAHEANHVYIRNGLGRPGTSFINEGLASALVSERYGAFAATTYHQWVRTRRGQVPAIADLVDDDRWRQQPQQVAYTVSASFLAYLAGRYGPSPLRTIYYAAPADFASTFQRAYGRSLGEVETEWKAFLGSTSQ